MSTDHSDVYESDGDEQLLIEDDKTTQFQPRRGNTQKDKLLRADLEKWQKQFLLIFATFVPAIKFVASCILLSIIASYDTLGYDLAHHPEGTYIQKADIFFLYLIVTIAVSSIILMCGISMFAQFPGVTTTSIDGYLSFRGLILLLELTVWIACVTRFSLSIKEHIATQAALIAEAQSIIFLKLGSSHRYNLDPLEEPCTMEMTTIKTTNLTKGLKPVPHGAPGGIEYP